MHIGIQVLAHINEPLFFIQANENIIKLSLIYTVQLLKF